MTQQNLLFEYASYELKKKFQPYIKKKLFYKLMYLLNEELRNTPADIQLTYYWYQYGPVVYKNDYYFNISFMNNFLEIKDDIKDLIDDKINLIHDRFRFVKTEDINTIVYKNAPFEFKRVYRELIMLINSWENGTTYENFDPEYFDPISCLDKLILNYPEEDFADLFPLFLEWENIIRYIFINYPNEKEEIKELVNSFSDIFSKKLRTIAYENIESNQIQQWLVQYKKSCLLFEEFMSNKNYKFYQEYYTVSGKHHQAIKALHELSASIIRN